MLRSKTLPQIFGSNGLLDLPSPCSRAAGSFANLKPAPLGAAIADFSGQDCVRLLKELLPRGHSNVFFPGNEISPCLGKSRSTVFDRVFSKSARKPGAGQSACYSGVGRSGRVLPFCIQLGWACPARLLIVEARCARKPGLLSWRSKTKRRQTLATSKVPEGGRGRCSLLKTGAYI